MPKDRRHILQYAASAAAIVFVFAAAWTVLDRSEHKPHWLTVEAPPAAVVGEPLEFRVALKETVAATRISCTLHRAGSDRKIRGFLASSGPPVAAAGGAIRTFVFDVPDREDTAYVSAIVFLSPTGRWEDGAHAAITKLIPLLRQPDPGHMRALGKTRLYRYRIASEKAAEATSGRRPRKKASIWVHPILFVLLLASARLCAAKTGRPRPDARPEETRKRAIWLAYAAVFVLSAFLELSGIVGHLAAWGRRLAQEQNIYDVRKTCQKAIMAALAAAGFGLSILFIKAMRRPGSHRYLWGVGAGLAVYLSVSFISVLSFHAVDAVKGMIWGGISPVDGARGAGALGALIAAVFALGAKSGKAHG